MDFADIGKLLTDGRRGLGMTFAYRSANLYVYSGNIPLTEAVGSL
jgi:hypothetical protein